MDLERLLFTRANIENVGELLVIIHRCMNEVNYKDYASHEFKKYLANFIYESVIYAAGETGGAYVIFPYDIRENFGRGRVKVHATFDGEPYDGSVVNMGVRNADGSVCYIIGVRKDIRSRIGKQPGDKVMVTVRERE